MIHLIPPYTAVKHSIGAFSFFIVHHFKNGQAVDMFAVAKPTEY